jgi:hypothetical protein
VLCLLHAAACLQKGCHIALGLYAAAFTQFSSQIQLALSKSHERCSGLPGIKIEAFAVHVVSADVVSLRCKEGSKSEIGPAPGHTCLRLVQEHSYEHCNLKPTSQFRADPNLTGGLQARAELLGKVGS